MASTLAVDKIKKQSGDTFTLPSSDGSSGQFIKTDASGNLAFATGLASVAADTTPQLGGDLDCNGAQIQWSKGSDVASATALPLLTDGNYFDVTGTATVTSFNATGGPGTHIKLHFDGACTLTHNSDLILPSGANIVTAAGDEADFVEFSAGDYRCTSYTRASGAALKIADDSIDSAHYAAASIDAEHLSVGKDGALSLSAAPTPDHTINGPQTNTLLAGYTTAIGDLVYLDPNGRWEETDANATGTAISLLGIAMEVKSDGAAVNVALPGSFIVDASWSFGVGVPLYVHTTAGEISATKPTGSGDVVRTVGYALTATTIFFAPSSDYVTLA